MFDFNSIAELKNEARFQLDSYNPPIKPDPFYTNLTLILNTETEPSNEKTPWESFGQKTWQIGGREEMINLLSDYIVTKDDVDNHLEELVTLVNIIPDTEFLDRNTGNPTYALNIKQSLIPNAGYGLFTLTDIQQNSNITIYSGITTSPLQEYNTDSDYILTLNHKDELNQPREFDQWRIDGQYGFKLGDKGRWANTQIELDDNNCEFRISTEFDEDEEEDKPQVFIVSIKDINSGDEIYVDYGEEYRENLRLRTKKKQRIKLCIQCGIFKATLKEEMNWDHIYCSERCQIKYYSN